MPSADMEFDQGKHAVDAAKLAGVEHTIFMSVAEIERFAEGDAHLEAKMWIEEYIQESGIFYSLLGPTVFFENFDDPSNWNPLHKGSVKMLTLAECKWCAAYDIGRAAAVQFQNPTVWAGKKLDVVGWSGDLAAAAAALEKVGERQLCSSGTKLAR